MSFDSLSPQQDGTSIAPDDEPRLTLLRAAATGRPLDEVASLISLLKETGGSPGPGDEALRMAVVSRPVDDVRQLITLLGEPPHSDGEATSALREAAMSRSIEDVAALVTSFGPETAGPARAAERTIQPAPVAARTAAPAKAAVPAGEQAASQQRPQSADAPRRAGRRRGADDPSAVRGAARGRANGGSRTRPAQASLRSALRWPAAVALLVVGAIHLPTDITGLRSGDVAAGVSLAIAALCLVLAVMLAVQDTVWIWAASATAAVGTMVLHSVAAGLGPVHLLRDSLGRSITGATTAVLACAAVAAILAASALLRRQKSPVTVSDA